MMPRALVTGAASGIGLETSLQLAQRGHHVILADRNVEGGRAVAKRILDAGGNAEFRELDLADLSSVRAFAADEAKRGLALELLVNNAGLLAPMNRATTRDGFELLFGIAHLGHFALTGLLLPALLRARNPRVISVASIAHAQSRLHLDDLQHERSYLPSMVYARTKLACLMFAFELQRRADAAGAKLLSIAAHPGVARTPLATGWESEGRRKIVHRLELMGYRLSMRFFSQTASEGAQSLVYAACEPGVVGGGYYGPTRFGQMRGTPGAVRPRPHALDRAMWSQLWDASETLTGVSYRWT